MFTFRNAPFNDWLSLFNAPRWDYVWTTKTSTDHQLPMVTASLKAVGKSARLKSRVLSVSHTRYRNRSVGIAGKVTEGGQFVCVCQVKGLVRGQDIEAESKRVHFWIRCVFRRSENSVGACVASESIPLAIDLGEICSTDHRLGSNLGASLATEYLPT